MPATRMSSKLAQITPAQRRDEVVSIVAAGLVRLIRGGQPPVEPAAERTRHAGPVPSPRDERLPPPGSTLTREYRGRVYTLRVLSRGFEYEGNRSLRVAAPFCEAL